MPSNPWARPELVQWTQWLLDSFRRWTGRELLDRTGGLDAQAAALFAAPFVVVSHGTQDDPVLNYGNRAALELWELDWDRLTATPSRLTAEPTNRADRKRMLARAATHGYVDDYSGVRLSATGRRFRVERALIWNILDPQGRVAGQAATFSRWVYLDTNTQAAGGSG
ncbi:MAG: MEKHLA domain-containing protein [Nitrospirales bacterium]